MDHFFGVNSMGYCAARSYLAILGKNICAGNTAVRGQKKTMRCPQINKLRFGKVVNKWVPVADA